MGFTHDPNVVFGDYNVDGIPASGMKKPVKSEIRALFAERDTLLAGGLSSGSLIYDTRAALYADLSQAPNAQAWVVLDSTPAYNGIYRKAGASGSGSWSRIADLPYSFVRLTDVGAGTDNAIQLTSGIPTSASVLRVANIFEANSGNVQISENGGTSKFLLTNSGNHIAPGGLVAGGMIVYVDDGTEYRLLSDQASASIVAAAEAAQAAAEAAALDAASSTMVVATRSAMKALNPAVKSNALLTEKGRAGIFVSMPFASLSGDDQTDASGDTQEADYVIDANSPPYVWVRKLGVPRSAQRYGMHPDASASDNVTALNAALAREPYVVIPAEANPYMLDARITSTREGQIIEGEGFNTVLKASASYTAGHAMIQTTTGRRQVIRDLTIDADSKVSYGVKLDYPKCDLVAAQVKGTNSAGVWMSYFSTFVGDGCNISNNNSVGILVQDGTGQVNDMRIGGGRRSICESNGYHGIYIGTAGRDGFWIQDWNMEQNNTGLTANGSHVTIDAAVAGVHIKNMYHETDLNLASARFYRFASSIQGIGMNNIKMNASSVTTKPAYFITLAYSGGNIGQLSLDNIWAGGFTSALVLNNLDTSSGNDLRFGQIYVQSGSWYSSSTKVRLV